MREQIRIFVAACFYYSGLVKLAHWWIRRRSGRCLLVLKYHRARGDLRRQLLYLSRHYRIMHLEAALEELYSPHQEEKLARDRRLPLALTFDDGYRDNYTYAFALARELQIPITIFIAPGYIESGVCFWWLESRRLVHYARVNEVALEGCVYSLERAEERAALTQTIDTRLMYASSVAQREAFLEEVRELLDVPGDAPVEEAALPLTWGEVLKMEESGLVLFGAHTMNHPVLACLADPEEVRWEVEECRRVLERRLDRPVRTFAYPIGSPENIGEQALCASKAAGYTWAFTTTEEVNTPQTDPLLLKRLNGNENTHWLVMASELVGLLRIVSRLKKRVTMQNLSLFGLNPRDWKAASAITYYPSPYYLSPGQGGGAPGRVASSCAQQRRSEAPAAPRKKFIEVRLEQPSGLPSRTSIKIDEPPEGASSQATE